MLEKSWKHPPSVVFAVLKQSSPSQRSMRETELEPPEKFRSSLEQTRFAISAGLPPTYKGRLYSTFSKCFSPTQSPFSWDYPLTRLLSIWIDPQIDSLFLHHGWHNDQAWRGCKCWVSAYFLDDLRHLKLIPFNGKIVAMDPQTSQSSRNLLGSCGMFRVMASENFPTCVFPQFFYKS